MTTTKNHLDLDDFMVELKAVEDAWTHTGKNDEDGPIGQIRCMQGKCCPIIAVARTRRTAGQSAWDGTDYAKGMTLNDNNATEVGMRMLGLTAEDSRSIQSAADTNLKQLVGYAEAKGTTGGPLERYEVAVNLRERMEKYLAPVSVFLAKLTGAVSAQPTSVPA